jgi:hypothetical protein
MQNGPGPVSGSAGGQTSLGANGVTRCPETLGTLAIDDGRREAWWGAFVAETHVTTVEPMIRLVIQQSNCFQITTVGSMDLEGATDRIRGIQRSDEFRSGSRQGKGQRIAADYFLQPAILFAGANTGGIGGALGAFGGYGAVLGGLAGGLSQNSASVTMSLFDLRSGVQIAESEGSASASNFGAAIGGLGFGGGGGGGGTLAAYQRTPAGQTTVASFVDAYNKLVLAVTNYKAQTIRGGAGTGGLLRVN